MTFKSAEKIDTYLDYSNIHVVKIEFDFKSPVDAYIPKYFILTPNAKTHARAINHHQNPPLRKLSNTSPKGWQGPVTLTLPREADGYGFTLRYFIVYPPNASSPSSPYHKGFNRNSYWLEQGLAVDDVDEIATINNVPAPLDTFFVKCVNPDSSADHAGLKSGDRIVSVNGDLIGGKTYKDVVELIQYCTGDLKLGVVPRNEDILQLVYEEYIYDGASLGYTEGYQHIAQNFEMHQPSVNKWSVPIVSRRSLSLDNPQANLPNNSNIDLSDKKYEPCVQFIAGTPIVNPDSRSSRSDSVNSSESNTPFNKSGKTSPLRRRSASKFDPCVSFIAGKPQVNTPQPNESPKEESGGVPAQTLKTALSREVSKKGYSIGTRLAPKMIQGVSKPGAVSNIAGLFASGNYKELQSSSLRKHSATSVLRDDFIRSSRYKNEINTDGKENNAVNFSLPVSVDNYDNDPGPKKRNDQNRRNNLSSLTSQATLVKSKNAESSNVGGISALVSDTIFINGIDERNIKINGPNGHRKRNLFGRKRSMSSVENSEDEDDSHVESADESELNNWTDRRVSYLQATAEKVAGKLDSNMEADDEDSDSNSKKLTGQKSVDEYETRPIIKEGPLNRKLERSLDRKKASARTWKPVYAVLKGHRLFCYKERGLDADDDIIQPIPVRSAIIEIASDYSKRRHVLRVVTSHRNEYLFQAEDTSTMMSWIHTLREANPDKESLSKSTATEKKEKMEEDCSGTSPPTGKGGTFKDKKGLSLKRSTFGIRNSKKGRSSNAPVKASKAVVVTGKTFGLTLKDCTPAQNVKNVPFLVEHCCNTIEDKGKGFIGIYRVPGNAAAVQALQAELDTKDHEDIDWGDEKWYELNNIGSLLKSYLRKLAEPVIPKNLYNKIIQANRISEQADRLKSIRNIVKQLPEYHLDTLQFLIRHLKVISDHSDKNKMESKNIAIVFGPTVVRPSDENVLSMVKDMSDQCKIIETLLCQCEWVFNEENSCAEPVLAEFETEVLSVEISKGLMDCINNQQSIVEQENENISKKSNKFQSLKTNISMKLRSSSKVTSPKFNKKPKFANQEENENDTDDDTSGCYSQSPPLSTKNEKNKQGKFKTKETRHVNSSTSTSLHSQKLSDSGTTNIGSFRQNAEVQIHYNRNLKSPQLSPCNNRRDPFENLTEKTLNRINQMNLTYRNDDDEMNIITKDDGHDSGVTSPPRLDSDDNSVTSDSGANSSRKESLDSLSGPSPLIHRRILIPRQQSYGSDSAGSDQRSPTLPKSATSPTCPAVKEEREPTTFLRNKPTSENPRSSQRRNNITNKDEPIPKTTEKETVIKRGINRRNKNTPVSPRASKRELCSILPGDGNEYEEKMRALLDPNYTGEMKEKAQSEMNQSTADSDSSSNVLVNGVTPTETGPNSDWWLSGSQNISRRFINPPKDKAAALDIISSVIDSTKRRTLPEKDNDGAPQRKNPLLSSTGGRRVAVPQPVCYSTSDLHARTDSFKHKKEELEKKVNSILGPDELKTQPETKSIKPDKSGSNTVSTLSETQLEKLDKYWKQVSELLSECDNKQGYGKDKLNTILQTLQKSGSPSRRLLSDGSIKSDNNNSSHKPISRSKSANSSTHKYNRNERTSPLLDSTYSNLNYSKLYPR